MKLCNKKLLSIGILVLCIACIGFVGAVSADGEPENGNLEKLEITTINIKGIVAPEYDKDITTNGITTDTEHLNISSIWVKGSQEVNTGKFEEGTYKLEVQLELKDGYKIANDCSINLNPNVGTAKIISEDKIVVEFNQVTKPPTNIELTISGITKPVANATPITDAPTLTPTDHVTPSPITWKANENALEDGAKFGYDTVYTAEFTITADNSISSIGTVTLTKPNDATSISNSINEKIITVNVVYPATAADKTSVTPSGNEITSINITVDEPETGKSPATSVKSIDNTVDVKGILWSMDSNEFAGVVNTFVANTKYYAKITLQNKSGYVFGSTNPTIKVNGESLNAAQITKDGNNKLIVIVDTFDTTSASTISSVSVEITAPATGNLPATNGTTGATTYEISDITWYKNSTATALNTSADKFEQSAVYEVKVTLKPASSKYSLSGVNSSNAKINGNTVSEVVHNSDKTITISHTFPATDKLVGPGITFSIDPAAPTIPSNEDSVVVTYKYSITGNPLNSTLYFGDGSFEDLGSKVSGSITHVLSAGSYLATLRSSNENADSEKQITFTVSRDQLLAKITASPSSGAAPLTVTLTDASSGVVTSRSWDFGDGSPGSTEKSVTYTYQKPGTYTVKLTVSDGKDTSSTIQSITVTEAKKDTSSEKTAKEPVDYEPLITIGDVDVPSPVDLIAEFVRLFQSMLDFDNYHLFGGGDEA